jgi:hypothetical protein
MRMQEFFDHHGLARNPFADEDAQSDPVFKQVMSSAVFHPAWDKIYGRAQDVSTAIVFGEKGSGKTALRLQIQEHVEKHNIENPDSRIFVIQYDDFNPLLDRFNESKGGGGGREVLKQWTVWDHMDSILSLGLSSLGDRLTATGRLGSDDPFAIDLRRASRMSSPQKRDLLLLSAFYDRSAQSPFLERWMRLAGRLRYGVSLARWPGLVGWAGTALVGVLIIRELFQGDWATLGGPAFWAGMGALLGVSWFMNLKKQWHIGGVAKRIVKNIAVVPRHAQELSVALSCFWEAAIHDQPMPISGATDVRYQLLAKFQAILKALGFGGILVLMDRVDEPQLVNGSPEAMRDFVWPLLDNKLLKHQGLGFKLLLPIELSYFLPKESKEFYERSRLDKQNTVRSLEWSGQALYDMASERLTASLPDDKREEGAKLTLRDIIDESQRTSEIINSLDHLRVPRHLFKFLYRLITEHCNAYTSDEPEWRVKDATFQSVLKLYLRDLDAFDKGYGHG